MILARLTFDIAFGLTMLAIGTTAHGSTVFENSYVAFRLPDGWRCQREGNEFVCRPPIPPKSRTNVIFVLAAKYTDPRRDNLAGYRTHLDALGRLAGNQMVTEPTLRRIGAGTSSTVWIDATVDNSEIPGYRTRYLATTKDPLAILVTFSARIRDYPAYQGEVFQAVQSLRAKPYPKQP